MYKKKFKPVITRVKLNPEQAVLQCSCFSQGYTYVSEVLMSDFGEYWEYCIGGSGKLSHMLINEQCNAEATLYVTGNYVIEALSS